LIANNIRFIIFSSSLILLSLSLISFFSEIHWFLDLFSHFKVQYLIISIVFLLISFFKPLKSRITFCILIIATLIQALFFLRLEKYNTAFNSKSKLLTATSINILSSNQEIHLLKNYIQKKIPDILFLYEITPNHALELAWLKDTYPFGHIIFQNNNFGIGVFSKYKLSSAEIYREPILNIPSIYSLMEFEGENVGLVAVHPMPPISKVAFQSQKNYFEFLAEKIKNNGGAILVCGDFNTTPWSRTFQKLIASTGLNYSRRLNFPTWPTHFALIGIPIDHCLATSQITIQSYKRGPFIGSDHYPIEIELKVVTDRSVTSSQ
jgi:endonuclease/exonuclease/phosphatase (EEP) superfamily protein YafD